MDKKVPAGSIIDVWFSCGAASAVAAKLTLEKYGDTCDVRIINNPISNEDDDNRRFLKDVSKWLGKEIVLCTNPKYPLADCEEVWETRKYMSGVAGAPCTLELKKKARQYWEEKYPSDYLVLGFTFEESSRADRFRKFERENLLTPLQDYGFTKKDCYEFLTLYNIELPNIYKMGYPNANCIGCVKSSSPTYWNHVRKMHPEVFDRRAEQSRRIGCRLVKYKGERMFLDELPVDAIRRPLKNLDFECGIFCEMK